MYITYFPSLVIEFVFFLANSGAQWDPHTAIPFPQDFTGTRPCCPGMSKLLVQSHDGMT